MSLNIVTWNIYWLGGTKVARDASDEKQIANIIQKVEPDVLGLQEIVDPFVMERILSQANANGNNYSIRSNGNWHTSDLNPTDVAKGLQKVFLCINNQTIEFIKGAAIHGFGLRLPYAAHLRHRKLGREFVVVVVHLRSGFPNFLDAEHADNRKKEASSLAAWLNGSAAAANPQFQSPGLENIVVLGDFNAEHNIPNQALKDPNHSLDPLNTVLPSLFWENPLSDNGISDSAIFEGDRYVIDHIILSSKMVERIVVPPTIYAWDYDPIWGGPGNFHQGSNGTGNLKGYEISDHRIVYCNLNF